MRCEETNRCFSISLLTGNIKIGTLTPQRHFSWLSAPSSAVRLYQIKIRGDFDQD